MGATADLVAGWSARSRLYATSLEVRGVPSLNFTLVFVEGQVTPSLSWCQDNTELWLDMQIMIELYQPGSAHLDCLYRSRIVSQCRIEGIKVKDANLRNCEYLLIGWSFHTLSGA